MKMAKDAVLILLWPCIPCWHSLALRPCSSSSSNRSRSSSSSSWSLGVGGHQTGNELQEVAHEVFSFLAGHQTVVCSSA